MKTVLLNLKNNPWIVVIAVSLGYFVDIYDIMLFSVVRTTSLSAIGVASAELKSVGILLQNFQLAGLLIGGVLMGVYADIRGRFSTLFISIFLYSIANILNAYVASVEIYALLRFFAGLGLAGELGVGVTLVTEKLPSNQRTIGTLIITGFGLLGGVAAAKFAGVVSWNISYLIGGFMGVALLLFRFAIKESKIFLEESKTNSNKGNLIYIFSNWKLLKKYLLCVLSAAPANVFSAILVVFSNNIAESMGLQGLNIPVVVVYFLVSLTIADILGNLLSKIFKTRKWILVGFSALQVIAIYYLLFIPSEALGILYWKYALLGASTGYWGVIVTNMVEQFGTNLRATVATSATNLVRGIAIPATIIFGVLAPIYGDITSSAVICFSLIGVGLICNLLMVDKFETTLKFSE